MDEVQRAPELLLPIKRRVDQHRVAGEFLLTGSANLLLMDAVADSLAGRAVYLDLPPFCPAEWMSRPDGLQPLDRLFEQDFSPGDWPDEPGDWQGWLLAGGFPAALAASTIEARQLWFTGYVQTYLERDLRQLSAVSNLPDFQRVMALAANRGARLLNQSELARDAALPQPTVHRYLNLLETGCLLVRLSPFATNPSTGLVKAKKLLWSDCGLAAWLAGIRNAADLARRLDPGFWLEQAIFQTLQVWRALEPSRRKIHFWRDRSGARGRLRAREGRGAGRAGDQGLSSSGALGRRRHPGIPRAGGPIPPVPAGCRSPRRGRPAAGSGAVGVAVGMDAPGPGMSTDAGGLGAMINRQGSEPVRIRTGSQISCAVSSLLGIG